MVDLPHIPPNETRYGGMTVNERLFAAGLLARWDAAVRTSNGEEMIAILASVELSDQAQDIADAVLTNPSKYER